MVSRYAWVVSGNRPLQDVSLMLCQTCRSCSFISTRYPWQSLSLWESDGVPKRPPRTGG